jgi:hypothetical protein
MYLEQIGQFRGTWETTTNAGKGMVLTSEDPFKLVEEDLKKTKDFAINNIVSTSDL